MVDNEGMREKSDRALRPRWSRVRGRRVIGEWEGARTQLYICHSILPLHSTLCIEIVHVLGTDIVANSAIFFRSMACTMVIVS